MNAYLTRRDRRFELEKIGVSGEALASLLDDTSAERHRSRVDYARAMAQEYFLAQVGEELRDFDITRLAAAAIASIDAMGVKVFGPDICGTARHPAFESCGSGRKHARDGGAWTAAIERVDVGGWFRVNEEGRIRYENMSGDSSILIDESIAPTAWRMSLAREGLRRSAGMGAWRHGVRLEAQRADLARWAAAVNSIAAEIAAEAVAAEAVAAVEA